MSAQTSPTINLLAERKRQIRQTHVLAAKVQFYTISVLIVYLVILGGIVGVRALFAGKLASVERGIETERLALAQLGPLEVKYLLLQNKLRLVSQFFAQRLDVGKAFADIYALVPEGAEIKSFMVSGGSKRVTVIFISRDVFTTTTLLNTFQDEITKGVYPRIVVDNLVREIDGNYQVTASFFFSNSAVSNEGGVSAGQS